MIEYLLNPQNWPKFEFARRMKNLRTRPFVPGGIFSKNVGFCTDQSIFEISLNFPFRCPWYFELLKIKKKRKSRNLGGLITTYHMIISRKYSEAPTWTIVFWPVFFYFHCHFVIQGATFCPRDHFFQITGLNIPWPKYWVNF